jgi:hypothetical protein
MDSGERQQSQWPSGEAEVMAVAQRTEIMAKTKPSRTKNHRSVCGNNFRSVTACTRT